MTFIHDAAPSDLAACEPHSLYAVDIGDFVTMDFPPREMMLGPVLPTQGLAMVYAPRGLGKTYFALSFAYAVASGGKFLDWHAPEPRRVLYIDGEMPAALMKERLIQITDGAASDIMHTGYLRIVTPQLQKDVTPDISTYEGQAMINALAADADLIVLDNLASLHLAGSENEGDSWLAVQSWLIGLRNSGRSVLIVHHSGKGGQQRGTSRREDVLDTVIALRRPSDYAPDQGARFEVHLEKARGIYGDDTLPFEASLLTVNGAAAWTTKPLVDVEKNRVIDRLRAGLSAREVAEEIGLTRYRVTLIRRDAIDSGALSESDTP